MFKVLSTIFIPCQKILHMKKLLIAFFTIAFMACQPTTSKKETTPIEKSKTSKITYVDLSGVEVKLSDYKGKKMLVNYWATWCGPCVKEMPALLKAQEVLKESNYVFLLISDESIEKISNFKSENSYEFNFLKLTSSIDLLGIYALPTTYIYNEKGEKVKEIVGSVIWDSKEMIQTLKDI